MTRSGRLCSPDFPGKEKHDQMGEVLGEVFSLAATDGGNEQTVDSPGQRDL